MRIYDLISGFFINVALGYLRMGWWLLHLGTTRSLPELGRETRSRQWYFGLSRGRVGLCQLFLKYLSLYTPYTSSLIPLPMMGDIL